jgi:hypothetical protein
VFHAGWGVIDLPRSFDLAGRFDDGIGTPRAWQRPASRCGRARFRWPRWCAGLHFQVVRAGQAVQEVPAAWESIHSGWNRVIVTGPVTVGVVTWVCGKPGRFLPAGGMAFPAGDDQRGEGGPAGHLGEPREFRWRGGGGENQRVPGIPQPMAEKPERQCRAGHLRPSGSHGLLTCFRRDWTP